MYNEDSIYKTKEYEYVLRKNMQLHLDLDDRESIATIAMLYQDKIKKIGHYVEDDKLLVEVLKEYIKHYKTLTDDDYEALDESKDEVLTTSELGMKYKSDYDEFEADLRLKSDKKKGIHNGYQYNAFNDSYDDLEQESLDDDEIIL